MGNLFKNGDISRWIRLVSGVGVTSYGLYAGDYFLLMLGVFFAGLAVLGDYFLLMLGVFFAGLAVLNMGCCCGGCSTATETKALYKDFVKPYQAKDNMKR